MFSLRELVRSHALLLSLVVFSTLSLLALNEEVSRSLRHSLATATATTTTASASASRLCTLESCGRDRPGAALTAEEAMLVELGATRMKTTTMKMTTTSIWDLMDALGWCRKQVEVLMERESEMEKAMGAPRMINMSRVGSELVGVDQWPDWEEGICPDDWEVVAPGLNATFEIDSLTKNLSVRLDGIEQPKSIESKFTVELCRLGALQGLFRIQKLVSYCHENTIRFTNNANSERLIRLHVGEDGMRFQLSGPEVLALYPRPIGYCRYILKYRLGSPGVYNLNLAWTQENWAGTNEMEPIFYPTHLDYPLGLRKMISFEKPVSLKKEKPNPVLCNGDDDIRLGRWVRKENFQLDSPFLNNGDGLLVRKKPDVVAMIDFRQYEYKPFDCLLRAKSKRKISELFQGKSVAFVGDSQTRRTLLAYLYEDCDFDEIAALKQDNHISGFCVAPENRKSCQTANVINELCYVYSSDGGRLKLEKYDFIFINFGQHCADSSHWPFDMYAKRVAKVSKQIRTEMASSKAKYIWIESFPLPFRKDGFVRGYTDWRYYNRLRLFNIIANGHMKANGIRIVPAFDQVLAFAHETSDNAHYPAEVLTGVIATLYHYLQA